MGQLSQTSPVWSKQLLSGIIVVIFTAMTTLLISGTTDRYRAQEAERDFRKIRAEIELVEKRMAARLLEHQTGGPHDNVAERLAVMENNYLLILDEVKSIKIFIRDTLLKYKRTEAE